MHNYSGLDGNISPTYVCILFILLLYLLLIILINNNHISTIHARLFSLLIGIFIGLLARIVPYMEHFSQGILAVNPWYFLAIYFIINTFKLMFAFDMHVLLRSWFQVLIMSTLGFLVSSLVVGVIVIYTMTDFSLTISTALIYGAFVVRINSYEVVMILEDVPQMKHIETLITGESIFSEPLLVIIFIVVYFFDKDHGQVTTNILLCCLRMVGGGIALGIFFGWLFKRAIKLYETDIGMLMFISLLWSIMSYHVSEELKCCGALTLVVIGIFAFFEKESLGVDIRTINEDFWKCLISVIRCLIISFFGIILGEKILTDINKTDVLMIVGTVIALYTIRFFFVTLMAPIFSRIGYGLTIQEAVVVSFCVSRGGCSNFLSLIIMAQENKDRRNFGKHLCITLSGVVIITTLITIYFTPWLLHIVGFSKVSLARRNNMNSCLKYISLKSENVIASLKMDKFFDDAKWTIVNETIELRNPYITKTTTVKKYDESEKNMTVPWVECPDCSRKVPQEPTLKELADMTWESRMRILKAKKVSYLNQLEIGLLSKSAFRSLNHAIEIAMDNKDALIKLDDLYKKLKSGQKTKLQQNKQFSKILTTSRKEFRIPMKTFRRICYKIIMHPGFDLTIYIFILINSVLIIIIKVYNTPYSEIWPSVLFGYFTCNLIFIIEFIIKIFGYSTKSIWYDGLKTYFKSFWNTFDFICLIAIFISHILIICSLLSCWRYSEIMNRILDYIILLKILKIFQYTDFIYRSFVTFQEHRSNTRTAFAYEIAKGYILGDERIEEMLQKTMENKSIREDCKRRIIADRLELIKQLGIVQKEKPWIANNVKTKHACFFVLNSIKKALKDLKIAGLIDELEYEILLKKFQRQKRFVKNMKTIPVTSPKEMFNEISWINNDPLLSEYLFKEVVVKIFDRGDIIFGESYLPEGVVILVSGLVRLSYIPNSNVVYNIRAFGSLPIVDYASHINYNENWEEYILAGNSFGEMSILTGRPSNCSVYAETPVQAYILKRDVLLTAFENFADIVNGLEARLWKAVGMRIGPNILTTVSYYENYSYRELMYRLSEAVVPNIEHFKVINISNNVEEVLLLYGTAQDCYTKEYYVAPCYIPRNAKKLIFPKSSQFEFKNDVQPKMMFLPAEDVNMEELLAEIYATSDLMPDIYHSRVYQVTFGQNYKELTLYKSHNHRH